MHESVKVHFQDLEDAIRTTAVPADRKEVVANLVRRLPDLYTQFSETNDTRYGDEITRVIQSVLKDLEACPEASALDAAFREKLHLLHRELGIPTLILKPAPGAKKTHKKKH